MDDHRYHHPQPASILHGSDDLDGAEEEENKNTERSKQTLGRNQNFQEPQGLTFYLVNEDALT